MESSATVPNSIPVPEPDLLPEQMVARAREMVPMLREQQDEAEERGFYSEAVHRAFLRAGFSRITQPRRFGGYEFGLRTFLETMVAISTGDPGSGWCLTLGSSHAWLVASHFPQRAQEEMFAPDGDFRCPHPAPPTGEGRRVDGGYIVNGRWPYASGLPYATWVFATGFVAGDDPPVPHVFAIPRGDGTMLDDWGARAGRVLGMHASGSNTFVGEDVFVPEHRVVPFDWFDPPFPSRGFELYGNPLYLGRIGGPYHTSLVVPVIGAARAALEEYRDYITTKPTTFQPQIPRFRFHEDQRAYGMATAMTDAAETILYGFADQYQEALERSARCGEPIYVAQDARWWALVQQAGGLAAGAVETLMHRATSSTSGRGERLGRYFRDVTMYRQHISAQQGDFAVRNAALYLGAGERWLF
jgi:3-hydroxy-9,10-secoandrosta-1,3,5(10)-triene-9,17-dione monooxygenase